MRPQLRRAGCCGFLAIFCITATGCFTPAHLKGIEDAHALAREFGYEQIAQPIFAFGAHRVGGEKTSEGRYIGECERDGQRYREFHFAGTLSGPTSKEHSTRCLRVLLPPASALTAPDANEATRPAAILEEFDGVPGTGESVTLTAAESHFGDPRRSAQEPDQRTNSHRLAITSLDSTPRVVWIPADGTPQHYAAIDRIRWRERSGLNVAVRVLATPLAWVGDAGLVATAVVCLPFLGISGVIRIVSGN